MAQTEALLDLPSVWKGITNLVGPQGGTVTWLGVLSRCHTLSGARKFSKKVEEVKKMGFFIGGKAW